MDWIAEPFRYGFIQQGFLAAALVSVICATMGTYVVLRGMAFIGGALAHAVLPGLVVAMLRGWNLFGGALVAGLITALGIGWISRRGLVREDTAIGILFTAMFAFGIVLFAMAHTFRDLFGLLFGDILGVGVPDLIILGVILVVVLALLIVFHKELEITSVDPTHATTMGLSPDTVRYSLLFLLALAVVAGIQAVGIVLTSALLVTPAAAASLITSRVSRMMVVSVLIALISSLTGIYTSFYLDIVTGPAIVLVATIIFGVVWLVHRARGLFPVTRS